MERSKLIRIGMFAAGLAVGINQNMSGASAQRADQDEGGRRVSLKPISESRVGGDGGNEWLISGAVGGMILLALGGLMTAKLVK